MLVSDMAAQHVDDAAMMAMFQKISLQGANNAMQDFHGLSLHAGIEHPLDCFLLSVHDTYDCRLSCGGCGGRR
jgi:hypothetical protein